VRDAGRNPVTRTRGGAHARDLTERVKELNCLRGIAALFAVHGRPLADTLRAVAALVVRGWQFPELACVRIVLMDTDIRTPRYDACSMRMDHPIEVQGKPAGSIEIAYPPTAGASDGAVFLDSEVELLRAVCTLVGTMVEMQRTREALERQAAELRSRRAALHRKNVALREILDQLESEKRSLSRRLRSTVANLLLPLMAKLHRQSLSPRARDRYVELLESHLKELATSSGEKGVAELAHRLSPREVEVADLVRGGIVNKEIAEMLGIAETTVERHRHNIRRKLGITDSSVNLASFLADF
jgi:DNA-binding CsgD family transcriptional regulator